MKYDASSIEILDELEAVRKRPGMYIGSTDYIGYQNLIHEIIDNSVDEIMNGYGDLVELIIEKDNSITIIDNGRGIPCDIHPKLNKPTIEIIFTKLHAGGKFGSDAYQTSGGLHGVGASVVNALCEKMFVETCWNKQKFSISFFKNGKIKESLLFKEKTYKSGTKINFLPDKKIFIDVDPEKQYIFNLLQEKAFLNSKVKFNFLDKRDKSSHSFYYENGIKDFIKYLTKKKKLISNSIDLSYSDNILKAKIRFCFQYAYFDDETEIFSYVNCIRTYDGGSHENAFVNNFCKLMIEKLKDSGYKNWKEVKNTDILKNLFVILDLRIMDQDIEFEGQTKRKLNSKVGRILVENLINTYLKTYLLHQSEEVKKILEYLKNNTEIRLKELESKKKITLKVNKKEPNKFITKLVPAYSKDKNKCELFLVEGESAGGTAKRARDAKIQGILSLKGKILNTEKCTYKDILENKEICSIFYSLGIFRINEEINVDKVKYKKIIIMTDADVDGSHIKVLLLTFFFKMAFNLIKNNMIYIAKPPLFQYKSKKEKKYFFNEEELNKFLETKKDVEKYEIQRYKGLGEMNPDQLWETTMNPATRKLILVTVNDFLTCKENIFILMGNDAEKRRDWIEQNLFFD
ncbi:DNA topoisomerase IV subunit B [symbiont of Argiope bruennichi]|uniref:toprim domain-containing protein n=1 Tax=symbiont of Argiope bruennichi TaxID=2810479 RepID=UPI003DA2321F